MVLGITGGIASGKSAVTQMLQARGAVAFSADEASHAILGRGSPILGELVTRFGPDILSADGALNRAAFGRRIFADSEAREQLNRITHPAVLRLLQAQIEAARDDFPGVLIVVEAPLLFEANIAGWFERIVVVISSETTQIARLQARNALDASEARRRIEAQWPIAEKAARADYVISNEGPLADLEVAVNRLWEKLMQSGPKSVKNR